MLDYDLVTFSAGLVDDVASKWRQIAGDDVYEVELVPVFDYCRENRSFRQGFGFVRGLRDQSTEEIVALVETVPSPLKSLTKLLKIWVSPAMWTLESGTVDAAQLIRTYGGAYVAVIGEAVDEGLNEVKMYGRDEASFKLLTNVCEMWNEDDSGWVATMSGRWMSLQRTGPA